ncbi:MULTISPECIES: zinc-finger domain-containing protein [Bacillus cereus group]|uniref:Actin binding protein n=1 Tax=Bacillus cereus (strain G9842) TaxID=405531 RepID=B7IZ54_BACC2|nr:MULTISPECIES: zinc-finger domain-containing protein [Bacillus cereus group]ACK98531.1 actin binding protein [Bacillus cereus G9842]MDR4137583.1 zinc-finger domain-containing protein [Bacillus cereus]MDR4367773.1 zinc-finger domain-containing protein [Bacillus cereus]PEE63238.1 zinc-finger domain-containing protein [Bacillus thuringiensis]
MMKMCNEKRNSIKKQQQLRSEVTKMTESSCFNCPILIENRKVLGNKKAYKECLESCLTLKKIQDKNKELEQEQVRFRKLFKNDKKGLAI